MLFLIPIYLYCVKRTYCWNLNFASKLKKFKRIICAAWSNIVCCKFNHKVYIKHRKHLIHFIPVLPELNSNQWWVVFVFILAFLHTCMWFLFGMETTEHRGQPVYTVIHSSTISNRHTHIQTHTGQLWLSFTEAKLNNINMCSLLI